MSFCIHGEAEACAKILCSVKELLIKLENQKDSKFTQNFYGNKTGFVRPSHNLASYMVKLVLNYCAQKKSY